MSITLGRINKNSNNKHQVLVNRSYSFSIP